MTDSIIIFLRQAVKGQVKSRLAVDIGVDQALMVYRWLVYRTWKAIENCHQNIHLYFDQEKGELENWMSNYSCSVQIGADLGDRMKNAFAHAFENSEKVVMIGSDCPRIEKETIDLAFSKLNDNDLVLGPAFDGGIYLIGLKKDNNALFEKVDWGSENVFQKLVENAESQLMNLSVLEHLDDVDRLSDFLKYKEEFEKYQEITENVAKRAS